MPNDASVLSRDDTVERFASTDARLAYEFIQLPTGRAGLHNSASGIDAGSTASFAADQTVTAVKTTGFVALRGMPAYWDHSANAVYYKKQNDKDYYLGRFTEDATSDATTCTVVMNVPENLWDYDLARDACRTVLVGTPAAAGFGYPVRLGGSQVLELTATNEAQKVDLITELGFSPNANAIVRGIVTVLSDGSGTVVDFSIGLANATHASDADTIAESLFIHLDANNTNINAESDDGTTEVAATDTTLDYTEGTPFEFWFDLRDPSDIQVYVNGANVLPASVFKLNAATGPLKLLAHLEKTASTDTYKVAVDALTVKLSEQ